MLGLFREIPESLESIKISRLKKKLSNNKTNFKLDLSNTLDKPRAVITLGFLQPFDWMDWDLSFSGISFSFISLVTRINSFTCFKLLPSIFNLKSK